MILLKLSDLQSKRIIDIVSGCNLGNVVDVVFSDDGKIQSLVLGISRGFSLFNRDMDEQIRWEQIVKIGEDVILVKKN